MKKILKKIKLKLMRKRVYGSIIKRGTSCGIRKKFAQEELSSDIAILKYRGYLK